MKECIQNANACGYAGLHIFGNFYAHVTLRVICSCVSLYVFPRPYIIYILIFLYIFVLTLCFVVIYFAELQSDVEQYSECAHYIAREKPVLGSAESSESGFKI